MAKRGELVDLIAAQQPETSAQGGNVVLTAPVVFANDPYIVGQIRLSMTIAQAEYIQGQLQAVLVTARRNARRR
jgi:hypothetical protein